ncbi:iron complex outermembrane recepter protein [Geopseudomonas sagittaria]|uniref:Iron complex outermembrane recepter protein n=1 Tax=Geopseudomonas sagittaria TaxID=1135990 RepID=A0A1I5P2U9_9GAMM|nr:TonB-dependent copper receptor [Pseudomonas sagittaria]SFP28385.1 iron complex outermembrane recepter protein [Pseudomonas sagittaria]
MSVIARPSLAQSRLSRPFALHPFQRRWWPAHAALLGVLALPLQAAEPQNTESGEEEVAPLVITTVAPQSPLTVVTDPRQPRQPAPASDGADYLKTIPGFSAVRSGGVNGDPVFRGMFGSRIKLLTNGGEMLGACPNRMDAPSSYISPASYDRLTVIKGPQTVLWGPGASAATVLFERDPEQFSAPDWRLNTSLLAGSNGRFDRSIDAAAGSQDGYARVLANRSQADDYADGNGDTVPSRFDKWNSDVALGWTPDANTLVELTAGKGDGESRYAGRGMDGTQFARESLGLRFKKEYIGEVFHGLEANVYYNYADHVMDNFRLRDPDPSASMAMMRNPMASQVDRRTLGGRLAGTWRWDEVELVGGIDAQRSEHRKRASTFNMMTRTYTDADQFAWNKDADTHNYGLFGELTWQLDHDQRLIGGARLDRAEAHDYRQTFTSHNPMTMLSQTWANPSADEERHDTLYSGFLRYEEDLQRLPATTYLGLGHSERFPDYWELFSASAGPVGSIQAFETVKPEKTTQLDLGIQYRQGGLEAWASAYAGVVEDYILFDYVPGIMAGMTRTVVENVDARIAGAEAGVAYRFTPNWKGDATLAYAWGENTSDDRALPQIPPLEARFALTYERDNWSTSGLWRVVAAQKRIAENQGTVVGKDFDESSGFGVLSWNGAYRLSRNLKFSAGVDNLLDKAYSEHLNLAGNAGFGFPAETRINEPGRTYWTRVDLSF